MAYINKSPVGFHGKLSSKNCLIDGHFKVKISDIETLLTDEFSSSENLERNSDSFLETLLWTCPTIIRTSQE